MRFASAKTALAAAAAMTLATAATAQTETVLYNFPKFASAYGGMTISRTAHGVLYGAGGPTTHGELYQLRQRHGAWKYSTLYTFHGPDGDAPRGPFFEDAEGSLYGATIYGGSANSGTVFEWNPEGETVLYSFAGGANDGSGPLPAMLHDETTGAFTGMTQFGGSANCGIVFQLTPSAGVWTETVLYAFKGGSDGCLPVGHLKMDGSGNLFGVTYSGGPANTGAVFELSKTGQTWTETVIYTLPGDLKGGSPSDIDLDTKNGRIYGVATGTGFKGERGTVFEVEQRDGVWQGRTIYAFKGKADGKIPSDIKLVGRTLYGTTQRGGTAKKGTIFKLVRQKSPKSWQETIVHDFLGSPDDGAVPLSALAWDPRKGVLYGVTVEGGQNDRGTVYQFEP
jgi:uncharacterized repeat protein (TIGR03803 family)